jgi:hypothetical protein
MTIADTVFDTINDNWGNGGYGGDAPTIVDPAAGTWTDDVVNTDVIEVRQLPDNEYPRKVNDRFVDRFYTIVVRVKSATSAAQLELLLDEVEYLLRNTTMTGVQLDELRKRYPYWRTDDGVFSCDMHVTLVALLASGAITPSTGAAGDATFGGTVTAANLISNGDLTTTDDVIVGDDVSLKVGGKVTFDIDADGNNYIYAGAENQLNIFVEGVEILRLFGTSISPRIAFNPNGNKAVSSGASGSSVWDNIYADDFVNESPYIKFTDALVDLKKIKDKDGALDYSSLPDWVCTTEKKRDKDDNPIGEKTEKNMQGFSVNRMVVFLWQALQEALARIEALEAK